MARQFGEMGRRYLHFSKGGKVQQQILDINRNILIYKKVETQILCIYKTGVQAKGGVPASKGQ